MRVVGPYGPAATVGASAPSGVLGRLVTGSPNVAPVPRAAASLALSTPAVRRTLAAVVPVALAVLAALLRRRR